MHTGRCRVVDIRANGTPKELNVMVIMFLAGATVGCLIMIALVLIMNRI